MNGRDRTRDSTLDRLDQLVSPYGVVSSLVQRLHPDGWPMRLVGANIGGLRATKFANRPASMGYGWSTSSMDEARIVAIAEGAERYSSIVFASETSITSSYHDLPDGSALDWRTYPRPSRAEIDDPAHGICAFDPDAEIRWVPGTDLQSGEAVWVPHVMASYAVEPWPAERFAYQISTGSAVHTRREEALLRALCEVVERDALAVWWLQMLALPRIRQSDVSPELTRILDWCDEHFITTHLYSIDLGLGVPIVICLQIAEHDQVARQVIGAGTGRTIQQAAERATLEALAPRAASWGAAEVPLRIEDFTSIKDGSRFMGVPARRHAFDFLDQDRALQAGASLVDPLPAEATEALATVVGRLSAHGMRAAWVDCTTPDIAAAGLTCVRVVVPELQPMVLRPPLAFRAHARLYDAPAMAGYAVHSERELNPWPHPMT